MVCPFCQSEDVYYSKKRKIYVCEDCDKTFLEQLPETKKHNVSEGGLELFFSYGHDKNRLMVERIKRDLEQRGHHVWIDTSEIKAGDHWRDDILNGVLNASSVIAFLSEHSTRNPGVCLDELKIAVCVKGANIKTVLLEPESRIKPPATLSDIQWLDMSEWYDIKTTSVPDFEKWYKEKFAELCKAIESSESAELSGDIHILKSKLDPYLNSEKEYNLLSKEFYGRKWLENYIDDWKDNRETKSLILYGRPGTGKSAFSVNYSHYNSDVYGCFFCEWNREHTTNPHRLIRTMAFRLATKLPDYRSMLLHQLDTDIKLEEMNAEILFDFLLTFPLSNLVDGNRETGIIVVDGLDEAEIDGDNPLAEVFSKCIERLPRWIKFVFTSRPEQSVTKYFQASETIDITGGMPKGYNDIMAYLVKTLAEELCQVSNKLEILNKICELSDGVFLYAEMLVTDIKNGFVKMSDISSFPKGLKSFYRLSMERKFPSRDLFVNVQGILELLTISETIPEELIRNVLGYSRYTLIRCLDSLGSWVNRYEENNQYWLGFSHKSLKDWFGNREQSSEFYVDYKSGALRLARFCRAYIENSGDTNRFDDSLDDYIKNHIGIYYVASEEYAELEDFLCAHMDILDPYWRIWNQFPLPWDNTALLNCFWQSEERNDFLRCLQREGNVSFLLWIFCLAEKQFGIKEFDKESLTIYIDIVHLSGKYDRSVDIINDYLAKYSIDEINANEFLMMLKIRSLHHSAFFRRVDVLLDEALTLYGRLSDNFPMPYNELLVFIGGKYGLMGDWEKSFKWLSTSENYSQQHKLADFQKRNIRKLCEFYCYKNDYSKALSIIPSEILMNGSIKTRYDAYLVCTVASIYTCIDGKEDDAIKYYEEALRYLTVKGIPGWIAHANLGIANINYKIGNTKEAVVFASRAREIYIRIKQDWGLIMSDALLAACESRIGVAPIREMCKSAIKHAHIMHFGSCVESIENLSSGDSNYLKLYFV